MCRRNHMRGLVLIAFGLGLLTGLWLEQGFWCSMGAVVIVAAGFSVLRQK